MSDKERPIGIFDSGIGGLTVFKEVSATLSAENILYLGDTARVPYGTRSPETVIRYAFECTDFLLREHIKLLVVACNTASAVSLQELQKRIAVPVIGVIEPGATTAARSTRNKKIGIIGTEATVNSNAYGKAIKALDNTLEVFGVPCPLFVPLVEEGWTEGIITKLIAEEYLKDLREKGIDTLVLGCTHYPLLKAVIQEVMGGAALIDSAVEIAKVVRRVLADLGLLRVSGIPPRRTFFVTDSPEKFVKVGARFLQSAIEDIERTSL